eukprot:scaffold16134_cov32-Tisochrysis_lutea.AAC.2
MLALASEPSMEDASADGALPPLHSRVLNSRVCPQREAMLSGVAPDASFESTHARAEINAATVRSQPHSEARCNGVLR